MGNPLPEPARATGVGTPNKGDTHHGHQNQGAGTPKFPPPCCHQTKKFYRNRLLTSPQLVSSTPTGSVQQITSPHMLTLP